MRTEGEKYVSQRLICRFTLVAADVAVLGALSLWMVGLGPRSASAATATDTFLVTATVADSCSVTGNDLNFGTYDPVSGSTLDGTTTVDVTCTLDTAYDIGLNAGTGTGATVTVRKMTSGSNTLNYSLFQEVTHVTVWGDTVGSDTVADTGTGAVQNHTVFGQIPASQAVPAGTYTDTITVTITY